jgi:molybdopterin converting factor small subunit
MIVTMKLFGTYINYLPRGGEGNSVDLEVPEGTTVNDFISMIPIPDEDQRVILLNGLGSDPETPLKAGDVVAIFQAMAGGGSNDISLGAARQDRLS